MVARWSTPHALWAKACASPDRRWRSGSDCRVRPPDDPLALPCVPEAVSIRDAPWLSRLGQAMDGAPEPGVDHRLVICRSHAHSWICRLPQSFELRQVCNRDNPRFAGFGLSGRDATLSA